MIEKKTKPANLVNWEADIERGKERDRYTDRF